MIERAPFSVGDVQEVVVVDNLTRSQIVQYAGASGDFNPLHTDEVYAVQVAGFPSVFAHGMLTMAMTGKALNGLFGVEGIRRFGGRFKAQVWPGDTLVARICVTAISDDNLAEIAVVTKNQRGITVFDGMATVVAKIGDSQE